jgi:phage/plasmid primase-like uncharacterized protein
MGYKGSRVINISGPKAGCWHDFEASKGGNDLISLYVYHYNIDYKEALKELANDLGIENKEALFQTQDLKIREQKRLAEKAAETQKKSKALIQQEAKKLNFVRETYAKCMPIKGTLAEKYLREFRGITGPLPEDFRFAPKIKHRDTQLMTPALVAPIRNAKGEIQSIVRTFLEKEGSKLNAKFINAFGEEKPAADKLNLGSMENAAVIVNKGKSSGIVYIAEGIETALSVAQAVPRHTVFAALSVSHLKNVPIPPDTQTIILCADEDGVKADSNQSLIKAVNFYLERGVQVGIAYPSKVPSLSKTDFNDLLKYAGTAIVAKDLKQTIAITEALTEQKLLQMRNDLEYTKENINKPLDKQIKELER